MKNYKSICAAALLFLSLSLSMQAFGYGAGWSFYPMNLRSQHLAAEFTGLFNDGGGVGLQGRYTYKLNNQMVLDGGAGISGGKRSHRFFLGSDYEIFPDYDLQPRFSIKGQVESAKEFNKGLVILSVAPTVSKGFSFWGKEGYPYLSLPIGLGLDTKSNYYHTRFTATLGMTGPIPVDGYQNFTAKVEANINLKNTYSGIFLGVSYPLD